MKKYDAPAPGELIETTDGQILVIKEPAELPDCGCRLCYYSGKNNVCLSPFFCSSTDRKDKQDVIYILWEGL